MSIEHINLQPLFAEPILEQHQFEDQHPGQASYVWRVRTTERTVVVRTSRIENPDAEPFWWGCKQLFGIHPANVFGLCDINETLRESSTIPVPRVVHRGILDDKPFVVVEWMPGRPLHSFQSLPHSAIRQFGTSLAATHRARYTQCGALSNSFRYPAHEFHSRMVATMRSLVERFSPADDEVKAWFRTVHRQAMELPPVEWVSAVMLDMDPTQFLTDGQEISALVDTEVYALGPREIELVGLEYLLDAAGAQAFKEGYETLLPIPDLSLVRPVYRLLLRLIEFQGAVDLQTWMTRPPLF